MPQSIDDFMNCVDGTKRTNFGGGCGGRGGGRVVGNSGGGDCGFREEKRGESGKGREKERKAMGSPLMEAIEHGNEPL